MLSYEDKAIKCLIHEFMNFEKSVKIPAASEKDACSLIAYLRYESAILFHLGEVKYIFYSRRKEAVLNPCYLYTKKEYEAMVSQLAATVQKIRNQICIAPTMLERELRIHDALCANVTYADDGDESHSIVGPLLHHRGVCDGISKTAKVLLQECGIESHVIFGTAISTDGHPEPHAWNVVCLNGKWYHLDITFDNTLSNNSIRYDYFNIPTDEITEDHTIDASSLANKVDCVNRNDYYALNNTYFDSILKLKEYLHRCFAQGKRNIQIRVVNGILEKDVLKVFLNVVSSAGKSIQYEQSINPARNVFAWSIKYN